MNAYFSKITGLNDNQTILDWNLVSKGQIICYASTTFSLWLALCLLLSVTACLIMGLPLSKYFNTASLYHLWNLTLAYAIVIMIIGYLANYLTRKFTEEMYSYCVLVLYMCSNIVLSHVFGYLSLQTGVFLSGATIVGWILFDKESISVSTGVALIFCIIMMLLTATRVVVYAPLFSDDMPLYDNWFYMILMFAAAVPHIICLLFLASTSIEHWKAREKNASILATTDSLTQIPNRRRLDMLMTETIRQSIKKNQPIAIAMFDIDNFKHINDNFGHSTGDEVLSEVINRIKSCLRQNDLIGRYGGDEFAIIYPYSCAEDAERVAMRCVESLRERPIKTQRGEFYVTISVGLKVIEVKDLPNDKDVASYASKLLIQADSAMYQAKRQGRDQLVVA